MVLREKFIGFCKQLTKWLLVGTSVLGSAVIAAPAAHAGAKGVIELYTSQGCSSCPPADRLAHKYADDPDLVVLTLPITYWDYLGWKDTFAKKEFTDRQYSYAALRGDRSVYTPQVVVNGGDHAVGSNARQINALLSREQLPVEVNINFKNSELQIDVGGYEHRKKATIWLALFQSEGTVEIGRGENRNKKITYTNIVREMRPLANWHGKAMTLNLPKEDVMGEDFNGVAVLLQTKHNNFPAKILGSASLIDQ